MIKALINSDNLKANPEIGIIFNFGFVFCTFLHLSALFAKKIPLRPTARGRDSAGISGGNMPAPAPPRMGTPQPPRQPPWNDEPDDPGLFRDPDAFRRQRAREGAQTACYFSRK